MFERTIEHLTKDVAALEEELESIEAKRTAARGQLRQARSILKKLNGAPTEAKAYPESGQPPLALGPSTEAGES